MTPLLAFREDEYQGRTPTSLPDFERLPTHPEAAECHTLPVASLPGDFRNTMDAEKKRRPWLC